MDQAPQLVGRRLAQPPLGLPSDCDQMLYRIASSRQERTAAFQLAHKAYTRGGLMLPNPQAMRVTPYHLLPTTTVFNAVHRGRVIFTMSLVRSGELGLPAELLYPQQVNRRRRKRLRLAEVTCLASEQEYFERKRMFEVFVRLVSFMFQFARLHDIDRLIIVVHPKQQRFYERLLGFEQFGENQCCPWVCHRPAVGLEHDFAARDERAYGLRKQIYGRHFSAWELQPRPMPEVDRQFFSTAAESHAYFQRRKSA